VIRLTVFSDHDLKHSLAGGANVNLEENLRRLSGKMKITLLCSWEPGLKERETVDGIDILRFKGNMFTLRLKIPLYFKRHLEDSTDIVWDEVDYSVPWFTWLFTKKPILMHCLHFQKTNFFLELPKWKARLASWLEPRLYRTYRNCTVLTISESTRQSLLEAGITARKIHIVHPGLDQSIFLPDPAQQRKKPSTPLLVTLSRLRAWKGIHYVIWAMKNIVKRIPEANLQIIGTGPYEQSLKALTQELELENHVQFLGRLSDEEKLERLKNAHVLAKTSGREGWGIDVLEANACLVPAVGWEVPGTKDSIQHEKTGILVPFGDTSKLEQEICRLLLDENYRGKLQDDAYNYSKQFTWEKSSSSIEQLLNQMLSERNGNL
jgi:glycosyltransferase involved in cell wall biosynthesis